MIFLLGIDTGGTFTDFVLADNGRLRVHKVLSTPQAPEQAIVQGIRDLGVALDDLTVVHGSTVATNAVLEGKGARTVLVTNRGLADLLTIGRQARAALYDLQPPPVAAPVPAELCLETGGRLAADGAEVEPLVAEDLAVLRRRLQALAPEAVAIDLLFSFLDDRHERAVATAVPDGVFVSRSSEVLPEYREYERGVATWLNARVGPLVQGYLQRLDAAVAPAVVTVMQSSGGTMAAAEAGRRGVHMLLSGPAGGLMGARFVGRAAGRGRLLTFDMGGTSTDVALIEGGVRLTSEGSVAGYPVAVPMVDMHTIGAGGGSIAGVDAGGLLTVGPQSAGADPGPACYGRGGTGPTVTDANLVLGRLRPDAFLGGRMALDVAAARTAVGTVAEGLGLTLEAAAEGIVRLANEHMAAALRVISVQRGIDPRGFALMCFGGAGGLHVCALAEALGINEALVPVHGGVLSALGMLVAPRSRQLSRTLGVPLDGVDVEMIDARLAELSAQGRAALVDEGVSEAAITEARSLDLRYVGQSYTLNVPWQGASASAAAFHAAHRERYGHDLDEAVELVNVRVAVHGPEPELNLEPLSGGPAAEPRQRVRLYGVDDEVAVYARADLRAGQRVAGPALVTETVATAYLASGWVADVEASGTLVLTRSG
jgi:N-methylhydantoinase A